MNVIRISNVVLTLWFGSVLFGFAGFPTTQTPPRKSLSVGPILGQASASGSVYVPDLSHSNEPMKTNLMAWNNLTQTVDVPAAALQAEFLFTFANASDRAFAITTVHPSCGCTTAKIPALPWVIPPGGTGKIPITVNVAGKSGSVFKTVNLVTERGYQTLRLQINIQRPGLRELTEVERAQALAMAREDRHAIFKGDCASCHTQDLRGMDGKELYDAVCGVCHEAKNRATMVPDLHDLKVPTNREFWQTWITFGKPGTLMPAFAATQGGVFNDTQIISLANYLNSAMSAKPLPRQQ